MGRAEQEPVPSGSWEVFDGTVYGVHSKPRAFWPVGLENTLGSGRSDRHPLAAKGRGAGIPSVMD